MSEPHFDATDAKHFRQVLGHFPTGVTIVTGMVGDRPAGFTIGSFTSVSLDPPLVGFLPQVDSDTWEAMASGGKFCVNVLRDSQTDLCWRFAKSGLDDARFDDTAVVDVAQRVSGARRASARGSTATSTRSRPSVTTTSCWAGWSTCSTPSSRTPLRLLPWCPRWLRGPD